jgi:hypothetical protein
MNCNLRDVYGLDQVGFCVRKISSRQTALVSIANMMILLLFSSQGSVCSVSR